MKKTDITERNGWTVGWSFGEAGSRLSRRDALRRGLAGAAGLFLADWAGWSSARAAASAAPAAAVKGKAKSVVQIWLWGGPCHIDTFDPKPGAGNDYCGPLTGTVKTNVDGIILGESLPELAKIADKYSLIRSMTHGVNAHETASYMVQTGWKSGGNLVHPCIGAVVSLFKGVDAGYKGLIPPYVVMTDLLGRFSEAGFLGSRYKPFATGGDPAKTPFAVEGVVAEGITAQRQKSRRDLLHKVDAFGQAMKDDPRVAALGQSEKEAYDLILGDAGKVFDLSTEKQEVREAYGRQTFGQACLMARRLVELGVPYVTINYKGWDTHKQHFQLMRQKLTELDKGLSSLLRELSDRGLLDTTVVFCGGEFGRTPKIQWDPPWNGGRNHFGAVFSYLVAGGGFKGGRVVGKTDEKGLEVAERPVYPWDLIGSIYELLGIDPAGAVRHPQGMMIPLLPSAADGVEVGGRLKEIM